MFIDTNANGNKDPGEDGVRQFPLTLRERDNSLLDQGQNLTQTDANGHYSLKESYPLSRWMVLEAFNTGYKTTGITVQADNEKTPTTYRRCSRRPQRPARHRPQGPSRLGSAARTADRRTAASSARSATTPRATRPTRSTP